MLDLIVHMLGDEDDAELWRAAIQYIMLGFPQVQRRFVEIGRCSHWLRPHQTRWTADGGFAWPSGYGGTGYSRTGLPLFDWSIVLAWTGERWNAIPSRDKRGKRVAPSLRIAIPSRTTRHFQAAIHTRWVSGKKWEDRFYGFRKKGAIWRCTAESEWKYVFIRTPTLAEGS